LPFGEMERQPGLSIGTEFGFTFTPPATIDNAFPREVITISD
jgi:hypothetical protein